MQQLGDAVEAVAGAELLLEDAADVAAPQGTDTILKAGRRLDPLEEAALFGAGQDRCSAGMGAVGQRLQAATVVGRDPGLDGAAADAQGAGDLRCGVALLGQDDRLEAGPGAGLAAQLGRLLQTLQGIAILDVHPRKSLWIGV